MSEKVFVKIQDGLGNQMFQYAFGLSLQKNTAKLRFILTTRPTGRTKQENMSCTILALPCPDIIEQILKNCSV